MRPSLSLSSPSGTMPPYLQFDEEVDAALRIDDMDHFSRSVLAFSPALHQRQHQSEWVDSDVDSDHDDSPTRGTKSPVGYAKRFLKGALKCVSGALGKATRCGGKADPKDPDLETLDSPASPQRRPLGLYPLRLETSESILNRTPPPKAKTRNGNTFIPSGLPSPSPSESSSISSSGASMLQTPNDSIHRGQLVYTAQPESPSPSPSAYRTSCISDRHPYLIRDPCQREIYRWNEPFFCEDVDEDEDHFDSDGAIAIKAQTRTHDRFDRYSAGPVATRKIRSGSRHSVPTSPANPASFFIDEEEESEEAGYVAASHQQYYDGAESASELERLAALFPLPPPRSSVEESFLILEEEYEGESERGGGRRRRRQSAPVMTATSRAMRTGCGRAYQRRSC